MSVDLTLALTGLFWGAVSAASLPAGAMLGLWTQPSKKVTSLMMAFGGGALLFALSIELFGHAVHIAGDGHGHIVRPGIILITIGAAVVGGLLFQGLNHILNNLGAFMRKPATVNKRLRREKREQLKELMQHLSRVPLLQSLPPDEMTRLVTRVGKRHYAAGSVIFTEGETGDRLYTIISGSVNISRSGGAVGSPDVATLGTGDVFGEIALVSDQPRTATVKSVDDVEVLEIRKEDFEDMLDASPALRLAVQEIIETRIGELSDRQTVSEDEAREWESRAVTRLKKEPLTLTAAEIDEHIEAHSGQAAFSIWLGIALDAIPESLIIGMLVVTAAAENTAISLAFIAGVFLANLPEALSSAVTMRKGGMKTPRIFWMWMSLCILTAVGAFIGTIVFPAHPEGTVLYIILAVEGLAGGAMLTMIAETMLPEAFELGGGGWVGISTLAGFLAALAVKLV